MTTLEAENEPRSSIGPVPRPVPWSKRLFDTLVGAVLCLAALPVILALALMLAVQHRGNPFFVHDRVGFAGRTVRIPKLRTLPPSTDPYADKTTTDLRTVGGLARFMRRTHLDELPQLFLVPLGRLSLVGPRPRMVTEAEEFDDPYFAQSRTSVPQGCTGLWQISAVSNRRVSDEPGFDLFYVTHRTARLDLWILWRTIIQFLGASPIELSSVPRWTLSRGALDLTTA